MKLFSAMLTALALTLATARAAEGAKTEEKKPDAPAVKEVAVLKTSEGEMVAEFWPEVAPKTVENFKKLAKQGFYDGTAFHRIVQGFMIQGGNPESKVPPQKQTEPTIKAEFNERLHVRGVLSMARSGHPDSGSTQFFICLDRAPHLDRQYTGFGKVIKGEEVLLKIGETPVEPYPEMRGEMSKPKVRVAVESVKIVPADSIQKK